MNFSRQAIALLCLVWLGALAPTGAVTLAPDQTSADLVPDLKTVTTEAREIAVAPSAEGAAFRLEAKGAGPSFTWVVVEVENREALPNDYVLLVPHRGFVGSGILWPQSAGSRVVSIATSAGEARRESRGAGADAYGIRVDPGQRVTAAFELDGARPLAEMSLWRRAAFDAQAEAQAFFRGVVLGIAALLAIAMAALYLNRASLAFPAATFFAVASVAFIALELGYLPTVAEGPPRGNDLAKAARPLVEAAMLAGVLACALTFVELRKRMPALGALVASLAGLTIAIPIYGWFEPEKASGVARIGFAAAVALGFLIIFRLWRRGSARAEASLLAWSFLAAWTGFAAVAALADGNETLYRAILTAGLVLALLSMVFTLAQLAFAHGFMARRFSEESGRRALALAGSRHYLWDWQTDEQTLHVGEELERLLRLPRGALAEGGLEGFLDIVHPLDRKAYLAAVETAERRGKGAFDLDFRLRDADGAQRWFRLEASAMSGPDGRTLRCIGALREVTEAKRAEERLLHDAVYDRVTGLPNRALLLDRLARAIGEADGGRAPPPHVLQIDLDRFKAVNDGIGHESGDSLLNVIGRRLSSIAGPGDTVARLPGDQFAVVFVGSAPEREIAVFTDALRAAIARPVAVGNRDIVVTASVGISAYRERGMTPDEMLREAAVALYEAKRAGKNTMAVFNGSMRDDRSQLVHLEAELRRALERAEIEVYYQPIARLDGMNLAGFEALARWRHPYQGLLSPASFLDIAEQSGLIREIGRYMLAETARQLGIWQRAFRPADPLFCAVNVSSSQLITPGFVEDVKAVLAREALVPGTLKLEVTESMVMENPEVSAQVLERLKVAGVGLACDDFGTGHSSLANLRRLPFDTLKVDKSFLEPDPDDARGAIVLQSVVALARDLGLAVVAEGIMTPDQARRMAALGCGYGQGFFIGEPMTARQVTEALSGLPYAQAREAAAIPALRERAITGDLPPVPAYAGAVAAEPAEPEAIEPEPVEDTPIAPPAERPWPSLVEDSGSPPVVGTAPMAPRRPRPEAIEVPPMKPPARKRRPRKKSTRRRMTDA